MQFFILGPVNPEAQAALVRHGHSVHSDLELSADTDAPASLEDSPSQLLELLSHKGWNLLTTDTAFIRLMYEQKAEFPRGVVVHLLDDPADLHDQAPAIDRLFKRYPRLTPKRLYTITPSRVKIRQLPGPP